MRKGLSGLAIAAVMSVTNGAEVDWRVFGVTKAETLLLSVPDIHREGQLVRVWTETLNTAAVDRALKKDKSALDLGARRMLAAYVPPVYMTQDLTADQIAEAIALEVAADKSLVAKTAMNLFELDCRDHRFRVLSAIQYAPNGEIKSSTPASLPWDYTPPGSNGDRLTQIVCTPSFIQPKTALPPK